MTTEFQLADSKLISSPTLVFECKKSRGDMALWSHGQPFVTPNSYIIAISYPPAHTFMHQRLSSQYTPPGVGRVVAECCLDEVTPWKVLGLGTWYRRELLSIWSFHPCFARRAKLNCFSFLNPIPLQDFSSQSLSQLSQAIFFSSFF